MGFTSLSRMAWRNLWRNRRRTIATTIALTLALVTTLAYSSMLDGYMANMVGDSLDYEVGGAQIFAQGYQQRPSIYTSMDDSADVVDRLEAEGLPSAQRLLGAGLAASGESSAGVQLRGIDVEREANVLSLHRQMMVGKWLDPDDPKGVVLGRKLANTLSVSLGGEVVVLSQAADGSMANEIYHARGILKSVGETTDRSGLFMVSGEFRELMSYTMGAHQILIKRQPEMELSQLGAAAQKAAGEHKAQTWRQLIPAMATLIDSSRGMVWFMFFILYVMVGIVIANAMLMAVFERIRELGLFKALGAGPGLLMLLIYTEAMMQVVMALVLGGLLGGPLLWYLATVGIDMKSMSQVTVMGMAAVSQWKAIVSLRACAAPVFMMFAVVSAAVTYPAVKAAIINPVDAMRHH